MTVTPAWSIQEFDASAATRVRTFFSSENVASVRPNPSEVDCLAHIASCSPHLERLITRHPVYALGALRKPAESLLGEIIADMRGAESEGDAVMRALRLAKQRASLTISVADVAGRIDVMEAARLLSVFADAALDMAFQRASTLANLDGTKGLIVLAMGKLGAHELNYSSDADIIVLFDPALMNCENHIDAKAKAIKVTKLAIDFLQRQTADGYVFRMDLRLRPDPGASAIAVSVNAAEAYYEAYGQNWERMAFIKARPCAADKAAGEDFLRNLRPFIWRKYMDFAAIDDIHAVKRQIHSIKGGSTVEFEGHDIKLGRGGIREVEFFAQTQQLLLGGKDPELRNKATLDALEALCAASHISHDVKDRLTSSYRYLRHVEHRLQMINDEQTHQLPRRPENMDRLSRFAGAATPASFKDRVTATLYDIQAAYDDLFDDHETEPLQRGSLVFTGVDDHPATLETLRTMGFERSADIGAAIRQWHRGGLRATRSERARLLLTKLIPTLLDALSQASAPDDAFFAFEKFLKALPGGVQVFSLLHTNPQIFSSLIRIMTISPRLGRDLSQRLNFIERLLEDSWAVPADINSYEAACAEALALSPGYEEKLNAVRRWANEQRFVVSAQLMLEAISGKEAGLHYSAIAETAIRALAPAAQSEMIRMHGEIEGNFAIIALGRLGSREMTARSDIDIMFVYDAPPNATSKGERPLSGVDYFARLVRRIVTSLSAATEEGVLYEVDMALRPSGRAGPAAVGLSAFCQYYERDAWTWEHMALTKAHVLTGEKFADKISSQIDTILTRPRDPVGVAADVVGMRQRLLKVRPGTGPWDVKNISGGLTDITFICQYLNLIHAHEIGRAPKQTGAQIDWFLNAGKLTEPHAKTLLTAEVAFQEILHLVRAGDIGDFNIEQTSNAIEARLASLLGEETRSAALASLVRLQTEITEIFLEILSE